MGEMTVFVRQVQNTLYRTCERLGTLIRRLIVPRDVPILPRDQKPFLIKGQNWQVSRENKSPNNGSLSPAGTKMAILQIN